MIQNYEEILNAIQGKGEVRQVALKFEPYETLSVRSHLLIEKSVGKNIVHLGCTDHINLIQMKLMEGRYLHQLLTYAARECLGVDRDEEAINYLKSIGLTNVVCGDIIEPHIEAIESKKWDYMILGELLEHTLNPVQFMKELKNNYGHVVDKYIVTVPNALGLIFGSWAIHGGIESINSDHKYWFTPYTIHKVLYEAGYEVEEIQMCVYETSVGMMEPHYDLLCQNPILLDDILIVCR